MIVTDFLCLLVSINYNLELGESLAFTKDDTSENNDNNKIVNYNDHDNKKQKLIQSKSIIQSSNDNEIQEDEIELECKVNYVVDEDTLDFNDKRIRLSLVDTPELGEEGYKEAKEFKKLCLDKKGEVDIDDGERRGDRYGRDIGVVFCDSINVNKELTDNNLARIYTEYCDVSEFKNEQWAKPDCQ
ncbi:MAG: thermonuclease family protein [Nitrososphaeraceae archaeon]|nr:thermonuclease family protein [Nitrososphaeraceae archaeon]